MQEEFRKHFACYILSIKETHMLPDRLQESLTSELLFFVKYTSSCYKSLVKKGLLEVNVNTVDSQILSNILTDETALFDQEALKLDSKFKLKKYIALNFPYVAACPYLLAAHDESSQYHYVPINELLKNVVSVPDVNEQIQKYQHSTIHHLDVLYESCDGDCQKNNDVYSKLSLKLQLYVDEFEVCNSIGPKHGKYKLTGVYVTIGNLPKRYRNTSDTVFCACSYDIRF